MIIAKDNEEAKNKLVGKIFEENREVKSRYGKTIKSNPTFFVIKNPEYQGLDLDFWNFCNETYMDRVDKLINKVTDKLNDSPITRRVSIPIWRPKDHLCKDSPTITEISFLQLDGRLNITGYMRSLNVIDFFNYSMDLINYIFDDIIEKTNFKKGTVGILIGGPHIYSRDLKRAEEIKEEPEEEFGVTKYGTHIIEDNLSSGWHYTLEAVYNKGNIKKTEWGEKYLRQEKSKYLHRVFIEVANPSENQIHEKAPFTKDFGNNYAFDYVIYANNIDSPIDRNILGRGEVYTYAERARYCNKDDIKVDQLYECIQKLKKDKYRRDCYVGLSREWDLELDEPPCLRGYQFIGNEDFLSGIFYLRSNDAYGALHSNMYAFSLLTQFVAELTGFKKHKYHHFSVDMHIYEDSFDYVKDIILGPRTPSYSDFIR